MKNLRQTASVAVFIAMSSHAVASNAQSFDDKDTQGSASTHAQAEGSFDRMPDEILARVLHHLPANDLTRFGAISRQFSQKKAAYQANLANALIFSTQYDHEDGWSSLVARQLQALDYLKGFKDASNQSFKQQMIRKITDEIGHKNQCAFVLKGSPLNLYFNLALLAGHKSHEHVTGFTLYQRNKAYFDQKLFPTESDETYKAIMAQHLFSQMALYVPKADQENKALNSFFNNNKSVFSTYLAAIRTANNYVRFSSSLTADQLINNHHIVITDDEISDPENKRVLSTLLKSNKDHKVVLDVGNKFVKDGCLYMKTSDMLEELAHLIMTNTDGHATSVGDNFLPNTQSLQSFDTAGLINVTSIGSHFLRGTKALQSFDTAGLTNVISIGNLFLSGAQVLQSFNTAGLISVTSIGNHFFSYAEALQFFDAAGLTSVRSIGNDFLLNAQALQSFDTSGLTNVASIGYDFLFGAKSLQSFDIARLVNIKSIGDYFLDGTPWLEMNKNTFDDWKAKLNKQSNQNS